MFAYLEILRPSVLVLAAFAVLAGALVGGSVDPVQIILAMLVTAIIGGAGNATNDYFDYEIDKVNRPKRPIPSGRIPRQKAAIWAAILYAVAGGLAFLLPMYATVLAIANILITVVYASWLKRTPIGHFVDCWLAASCFLFGSLLTGSIPMGVWILFAMGYAGNFGREVEKAIEDMVGDKKAGARTLPLAIGIGPAKIAAAIAVVLAIIISPLPWYLGIFGIPYLAIVLLADLVFAYSLVKLRTDAAKAQRISKIGMFIVLIAFIANAILG
jgi:geranylgeranylglycerol-phosphate geranylgeranyltransferase